MCHVRIASFVTAFTNVPFCHRTCNINDYIIMTCDFIIKKVNSFSDWTCPSNIISSPFKPENTTIRYSLKCSWNWVSSLIPLLDLNLYQSFLVIVGQRGLFSVYHDMTYKWNRLLFSRLRLLMRGPDNLLQPLHSRYFFKWTSVYSSLPFVFIPPNPTVIFKLWTSRTSLSEALKRELDCVNFCHTIKCIEKHTVVFSGLQDSVNKRVTQLMK